MVFIETKQHWFQPKERTAEEKTEPGTKAPKSREMHRRAKEALRGRINRLLMDYPPLLSRIFLARKTIFFKCAENHFKIILIRRRRKILGVQNRLWTIPPFLSIDF